MMPNLRLLSYNFLQFNFDVPIIEVSNKETYLKAASLHPNGFIPISPKNAGVVFGISWWRNTLEEQQQISILDCGNNAYQALMALESGVGSVICSALQTTSSKLEVKEINSPLASSKQQPSF